MPGDREPGQRAGLYGAFARGARERGSVGQEGGAASLDRCVAGCANTVRTDLHARQLRDRADTLTGQAVHHPQPIADRLLATAGRLRGLADTHDRTRITCQELTT
ncbi:hypothetical protein [Streptomyces sp. NPDC055749]